MLVIKILAAIFFCSFFLVFCSLCSSLVFAINLEMKNLQQNFVRNYLSFFTTIRISLLSKKKIPFLKQVVVGLVDIKTKKDLYYQGLHTHTT